MFPNACNISLHLLSVVSKPDRLGNKHLVINKIKEVVGIAKSITSKEYQTSVMINKNFELKVSIISFLYDGSKYAKIKGTFYKIERTFINGQFIELYLSSTELKEDDFIWESL